MKIVMSMVSIAALVAVALGQVPGGYREIATGEKDVVAAANFAIKEKSKKEPVTLVKIAKAEVQVVAGRNFRITMEVNADGKDRAATAVVWSKLDKSHELTKWEWASETK